MSHCPLDPLENIIGHIRPLLSNEASGRRWSIPVLAERKLGALLAALPVLRGGPGLVPSIGERVGAELEMEGDRDGTLAAFLQPRRPVAARRPHSAASPSAIGVVDAAVQALGIEAHRVGDAQHHPFPVDQRQQRVVLVAGRDRHVVPEPQRIVLIPRRTGSAARSAPSSRVSGTGGLNRDRAWPYSKLSPSVWAGIHYRL